MQISLNNTFTAAGRCAPIFATISGLSNIKMPKDEVVVRSIEGFVPGSTTNGSLQKGFIILYVENMNQREKRLVLMTMKYQLQQILAHQLTPFLLLSTLLI